MTHCYLCGCTMSAPEPKLRRRVKTGEWVRKSYGSDRVEAVQYHYGRRIVCRRCARYCDRKEARQYVARHLWPVFILLALLGWLLSLAQIGK